MNIVKSIKSAATSLLAINQRPVKGAEYMKGGASPFFFNWRPQLRSARDDVRRGYIAAAARAIDALHNSGWLAGGVEQAITNINGSGLRPNLKPDARTMGWDEKQASEWARDVERRFEVWAGVPYECDLQGKFNLGQIADAALRQYFATGEIIATTPWSPRIGASTGTKVNLLPSFTLSQDTDTNDNLYQGIKVTKEGLPILYRFIDSDPQSIKMRYDEPARDIVGRPIVTHIFDGNPTQMRGISPLAPSLRVIRQFDQLADATLTNALIQAILAATIESDAPSEQLLYALRDEEEQGIGEPTMDGWFDARLGWYKNTKIDLGTFGKVAHLFPGEKLTLNRSNTPNDNYEAFAKFLLKEIARCLGITYEQLTGDYVGATYSSVRMSTAEAWGITLRRRKNILSRLYQVAFENWLEEMIEHGEIDFPGGVPAYLMMKPYVTRCDWRGPAKPQADDIKAAKAHEIWRKLGVMSDEAICGELGFDWEDVYEQRAREKERRDELDLEDQAEGFDNGADAMIDAEERDGNPV